MIAQIKCQITQIVLFWIICVIIIDFKSAGEELESPKKAYPQKNLSQITFSDGNYFGKSCRVFYCKL